MHGSDVKGDGVGRGGGRGGGLKRSKEMRVGRYKEGKEVELVKINVTTN